MSSRRDDGDVSDGVGSDRTGDDGPAGRSGTAASEGEPLVRVEGLSKQFSQSDGILSSLFPDPPVQAVDDVSFSVREGETLGLVGESGCGKSTLARTVLQLIEPSDGAVYFRGDNLAEMAGDELRRRRQDMQMIFQDPQSSLDPRMKVGPIVEEPMRAHGLYSGQREERARELLETVGLDPQHYNRYPHQFSGGQRQRINLARALSVDPDFIVCDEPVSALDVSIQAQVLNTMRELQREFDLTYLFIAHDLSVIRHISDRVAVMYLGQLVEIAETRELFENPEHPYTRALLDSIPVPDPRASGRGALLEGDVPSPIEPPSGCRFHTRCPELIQPDEYSLSDTEWASVRRFVRSVDRRSFDPDSRESIEREFFDAGVPGGEAGEVVDRALSAVVDGQWSDADEMLQESFVAPSVCASELPAYRVEPEYGADEHLAACHLHRDMPGAEALDEAGSDSG